MVNVTIYTMHTDPVGWFPEIGVPLVIIHFDRWDFPSKKPPSNGVPALVEAPILWKILMPMFTNGTKKMYMSVNCRCISIHSWEFNTYFHERKLNGILVEGNTSGNINPL